MSDMKTFTFHYQDEEYNRKEDNIDSGKPKKDLIPKIEKT